MKRVGKVVLGILFLMNYYLIANAQDAVQSTNKNENGNSAVIAAVIAGIATLAATLITVYGQEIKYFLMKNPSKDLKGVWKCKWLIVEPADYEKKEVVDTVEITRIRESGVKGFGMNETFGKYQIEGRDSPRALTLFYYGFGNKDNLVGVIILKKAVLTNKLEGYWWQYGKHEAIMGGQTQWEKE
jgi:hypothetical protein